MKLFAFHIHGQSNPWVDAPPWAIELREMEHHIVKLLARAVMEEMGMAKTIDDLTQEAADTLAKVNENGNLEDSIIQIVNQNNQAIKDLQAQLAAAGTDPAKLQALSDAMDAVLAAETANAAKVAAAVQANTPAAPTT